MSRLRGGKRGAPPGEAHGMAVLTEEKVRSMRREHMPYIRGRSVAAMAQKYGVSLSTARDVLAFVTWRHVR